MKNESSATWKIAAIVLVILGCLFWLGQSLKKNRVTQAALSQESELAETESFPKSDTTSQKGKVLPVITGKQKNLAIEERLKQTRKNISKMQLAAKSKSARDSKKVFTDSEVASSLAAITSQKNLTKAERAIALGELRNQIWVSATPAARKKQLIQLTEQKLSTEGPPPPAHVPFEIKPDGSAHMTTKPK